jgi:hypothetical protein
MQVQKSIPQHINKVVSMKKRIYFLLNPNTNNLQEYYKQSKKKNMAISVGSYLELFKEFIPAH